MKDLSCLLEENGSCPCGNGHRLDLKMIKNVNGYNGQIQLYYSVRLFSLVVERALFSVLLLIFMVVQVVDIYGRVVDIYGRVIDIEDFYDLAWGA